MRKIKATVRFGIERSANYKHNLGQHFLYDEQLLTHMVKLAGVNKDDNVLEIGPGAGTLTKQLSKAAKQVVAVELDNDWLPFLQTTLSGFDNVCLVQGDALTLQWKKLLSDCVGPVKLVANLPYYITQQLLLKALCAQPQFVTIAVLVQKEVAEKIISKPGKAGYGPLSLKCQYGHRVQKLLDLPAQSFTPPPKVDSSFISLIPLEKGSPRNQEAFFSVVDNSFSMRRKTLKNNLQKGYGMTGKQVDALLTACNLPVQVRAEQMNMAQFLLVQQWIDINFSEA